MSAIRKISNDSLKTFLTIVIPAVISLTTGCSSLDTVEGKYNHEPKEITDSNYRTIVGERKSGVYKHPFYEGKLATFHFSQDKNAASAIKKDLKGLGIDERNFEYNHTLLSLINGKTDVSRHIQDPVGIYEDINYSYINHKTAYFLGQEEASFKNTALYEDSLYLLLMHEAGHSVIEQQLSWLDLAKLPFTADQLYYLENSSDVIAMIKTIQMMVRTGRSSEHINTMINRQISRTRGITKVLDKQSKLPSSNHAVLHRTVPSLLVIKNLYDTNPTKLLALTTEKTLVMADVIASTALEHNFKEDFINESLLEHRIAVNRGTTRLELGIFTKALLAHLSSPIDDETLGYKEAIMHNTREIQKLADSTGESLIVDIANEIASDPLKYNELSKENAKQAAHEAMSNAINELRISDINHNRYIGYINNMTQFFDAVDSKLRGEGV